MNEAENQLLGGVRALGLELGDEQIARLVAYSRLVLQYNTLTNLTGARSLRTFLIEHVLDSLSILLVCEPEPPVIDVGSGAGLPGIPIAIARPNAKVKLLDTRAKRVEFLHTVTGRLDLQNVEVIKGSALGPASKALVGTGGTVLLRAVAPALKAFDLGAGLVKGGGSIVLYQGPVARPGRELVWRGRASGFQPWSSVEVAVPGLDSKRHLWYARKGPRITRAAETRPSPGF